MEVSGETASGRGWIFLFEFSRKTGILDGIRKRESWSNETEKRTGKRNQPMAMDFHAAVRNPGGILGDKEVRITAISEYGFQTRLAAPATAEQKNAPWELAFYDQKTASYQRILLRDATFLQEKEEDFDVVYTFATEQEDYRNAVQHLALQYSQYIRWKMEDDDAALAEQMTGYPAEQDAFHLEVWKSRKSMVFRNYEGNLCGIAK